MIIVKQIQPLSVNLQSNGHPYGLLIIGKITEMVLGGYFWMFL